MSETEQLKQQLAGLQNLARLQRGLRLGIRALWLGVGGVILGWGINAVWGWLPNRLAWYTLGLALALFPIAGILRAFYPRTRWVWLLDRRLGLHEQVSTAWEVANTGKSAGIGKLLVEDVVALLPRIRARMLKRGWYLEIDLVSALIVLLLGGVLLAAGLLNPFSDLLGNGPAAFDPPPPPLPPLEQQVPQMPQAGNQPGDNQGGEGQSGGEQPGGEGAGEGQPQDGQQPGSDPNGSDAQVGDILRKLGQDLSRQAGTYDLGQALENLDLNGAADALEDLKEQLNDLSPESRDNLAEALRKAAEALQQAGEPGLAQDMADAANSMPGPSEDAPENLDQVAGDLRQLAESMGQSGVAGSGGGDGSGSGAGAPEPLDRLAGDGQDMELPLDDPAQSGLLSPSNQGEGGEGIAGGSQDSVYQPGTGEAQNPLFPSSFLWKWRDVVSQYFQR